jgi:arylsulfatase
MRFRTPLFVIAFVLHALRAYSAQPNIIVIMTDDQGWADIGLQGKGCQTPNLDRLAAEGIRMTSFYATQAVCTSSRTALLTGCYPNRLGLGGVALGPKSPHGLNPKEQTIAELLKDAGYHTGISGKWHLGDHGKFLPPNHGFDESLILPYSNDMWPLGQSRNKLRENYPDLYWIESGVVGEKVGTWSDMDKVLGKQFDWAETFLKKQKADKPFFLYIAPSMPHVPLGRNPDYQGKGATPYAEVITEIDTRVGQLLKILQETGADKNTLIIYTSDNGPWLNFGNHAGSAGPFREGKGTTWEGGVRVPFIACWPGVIAPNRTSPALAGNLDVLPTLVEAAGAKMPLLPIDGESFLPLLKGQRETARETFAYYYGDTLEAVRKGKWKMHLAHTSRSYEGLTPGVDGAPGPTKQVRVAPALYDLNKDPGERNDVSAANPDVLVELMELAKQFRLEMTNGKREVGTDK